MVERIAAPPDGDMQFASNPVPCAFLRLDNRFGKVFEDSFSTYALGGVLDHSEAVGRFPFCIRNDIRCQTRLQNASTLGDESLPGFVIRNSSGEELKCQFQILANC